MFPFWDGVVAPLIEASGATRVLEIGALRGDTTVRMLASLGEGAELHVIDPVPAFDPTEHEERFAGQYFFHRRRSLDVLPELPAFDVALIDGDHNWYTVFHELLALSRTSSEAGAPLPVLVLHDVGWPYGRRDLYYDPTDVPDAHRQPYAERGMLPGVETLVERGGLNPTMHNALNEGGPENGVLTALDDFVAQHPRPVRRVLLPVYFGLAIVADDERLAASPGLAAELDRIESADGMVHLLEMAEDTRLQAMITQHAVYYGAEERNRRSADRYLGLLKGSLLDEHYIENELRIDLLARALTGGGLPDPTVLRDPVRRMRQLARRRLERRRAGQLTDEDGHWSCWFPYTDIGRVRLEHLERILDTVRGESVKGDLVECGTGRGGGAIFLRGYLEAWEMAQRKVWVADRFLASPDASTGDPVGDVPDDAEERVRRLALANPSDLNNVRDGFARFDLLDKRVRFLVGDLEETLGGSPVRSIAVLRIGREAAGSVGPVLEALYDRITLGGFVVVDAGDGDAVEEFRARHGIDDPLERPAWGTVAWRKTRHRQLAADPDAPGRTPGPGAQPVTRSVPLAPEVPAPSLDLSVVVVFHDMRREAWRTLHSLSRAYQRDIDGLTYEVIAVDNGSSPDQRLDPALVRSFGPEFRLLDMGPDAPPSPVPALNRGVSVSRGRAVALMIDGAHVLTPGVLHFAQVGLDSYPTSVVVAQQWYLGPGQQGEALVTGYDQEQEDRLFEAIDWPTDGYRLFDIGQFIGERDWLDGMWESNCIVVPRELLEQVGAFDESFAMPGGGFANLELFERIGASPDVTVTTMLGEGTFHQVHGGTTTNLADPGERHRKVSSYARHYQALRGRGYIGPRKRIHYVGTMFDEAARTRPRRRVAPNYFVHASPEGPDGRPSAPTPVPEDLRAEYVDAVWRSLTWRDTRWLGRRINKLPTDLFAYQELIARLRPDWIIETGTGGGGRALFLASICDLVDHGRVLSIDHRQIDNRPTHPRITYLHGDALADEVLRTVTGTVRGTCLVVLGGCRHANRTFKEFSAYSPFVPLGGYVVVEDTVVNGHPVWANFGPGPAEAVKGIVESRGDWASDHSMEKYHLTFNANGYLKRVGDGATR